jgi:DNA-binding NarL/FixJ family response regulator
MLNVTAQSPARALLPLESAGFTCARMGPIVPIVDAPRELTPREHETAALATSGLSNKQIAHMLGLTEASVKQHLHRVFAKLGIQNRIHLILHADRLRHS